MACTVFITVGGQTRTGLSPSRNVETLRGTVLVHWICYIRTLVVRALLDRTHEAGARDKLARYAA